MVCDGAAIFAESFGDLLLGHPAPLHQISVSPRTVDRVQVFAMDVFNDGELGLLGRADFPYQSGYFQEARQLGGTKTAFSRDEFVMFGRNPTDDDRLNKASRLQTLGKLLKRSLVK